MLFVDVVLEPRYKLNYVKFFKLWYGKDKGDAMSTKVQDALKRLYMERMDLKGASGSSGSGSSTSLSRDFGPSLGNASDHLKRYNTIFKQHLEDEESVE